MSHMFQNLKRKLSPKRHSKEVQPQAQPKDSEQQFSIQPHPAKTNDPADLNRDTGGLQSQQPAGALHARDPHVPSPQIVNSLEAPAPRDELRARAAELNK
ncbi:hypothetical protein FA95DRAFT_532527 [Auriscalpium vulgare]|uniref:Uncharacterized protein n=1 Tax=Auriscalpium vulgare TaxID=40419 RepID=A0ACB8RFA3_9AGAM|nr:hypothetical protein FA95DRAFT_532527 [Auriscalpium vulgare]